MLAFLLIGCEIDRTPIVLSEAEERTLPLEIRRATLDRLSVLGYTGATGEPAGAGGVILRTGGAQPGFSLLTSGHGPAAFLIDGDGRELHRWIWSPPAGERRRFLRRRRPYWRRVELLPDRQLLALFDDRSLIKLDRRSRLVWAYFGTPHDDFELLPAGEIVLLTAETRSQTEGGPRRDEVLVWLSADGEELRRLSLAECFERSEYGRAWKEWSATEDEPVSASSLQWIGHSSGEVAGLSAGNLLVSLRSPSLLAAVDPGAGRVVWVERRSSPGEAELLPSGRLLLFENGELERRSRLLEIDPASGETAWRYRAAAAEPFFSARFGGGQRLANGNTLIVDGERGRAFELTPDGERVWEYVNPYAAGPASGYRAALIDLERLPRGSF